MSWFVGFTLMLGVASLAIGFLYKAKGDTKWGDLSLNTKIGFLFGGLLLLFLAYVMINK